MLDESGDKVLVEVAERSAASDVRLSAVNIISHNELRQQLRLAAPATRTRAP